MRVFLKRKSKLTVDCCFLEFSRRGVERKHLMRFQISASGVLWRLWRIVSRFVSPRSLGGGETTGLATGLPKWLEIEPRRNVDETHLMRFQSETSCLA